MAGSRIRGVSGSGAVGAILAVTISAFSPQPASAQGFFESLFGGFGDDRPRARVRAPAYAPNHDDRFPVPDFSRRSERQSADIGGSRGSGTHCVRLCDGRYFPLPRSANGARLDPVKVCSALCPAAQTKVFNGGNMEYASAADGSRYADLNAAFAFRDKIVPDCSCTGRGPGGLAQIDVESDPTLRAGDVVVTAAGPTVFRGSNQFPYKTADFTPVDDYARLNSSLRQKLSELQVDATASSVLPPQKIDTTPADTKSAKQQRPRRARVQTTERRGRDFPEFRSWW